MWKCCKKSTNFNELIYPESVALKADPVGASLINRGFSLLHAKMKNGGTQCPAALIEYAIVTVATFLATSLYLLGAMCLDNLFGTVCKPLSSML